MQDREVKNVAANQLHWWDYLQRRSQVEEEISDKLNLDDVAGLFLCAIYRCYRKLKDAHFLLDDNKTAISSVGSENLFVVCLDGACKKTLRLIWDSEDMNRIFPQRCTTHGYNLLVADVGKNFKTEIALCVRLVKFICNHDRIFSMFSDIEGALQLLGVVETRFASQIYSSKRILADKEFIRELFPARS